MFTGLAAYVIEGCIGLLVALRRDLMDVIEWPATPANLAKAWFMFTSWNLVLVALVSYGVCQYAPAAAGSGIPEIKGYLNGVNIPGILRPRTIAAKLAGTIGIVSSGLTVGPEGPLVHIGAIIGSILTMGSTPIHIPGMEQPFRFHCDWLKTFNTDIHRRDFIAIGAASGFAAAFGAPIGGMLFSLEEAASFWSPSLMWRTFTATSLACFTLCYLKTGFVNNGLSDYGLLSFESDSSAEWHNSGTELIPFTVIGVMGGLLGALFVRAWENIMPYRAKTVKWRVLEACLISAVTSTITFILPLLVRSCQANAAWEKNNFGRHFDCTSAEYNDAASILFGSREESIKLIIDNGNQFSTGALVAIGTALYALMLVSFGGGYPAGLFMPTILVGCSLGGALGNWVEGWLGDELHAPYALMGAVSLLGGIQRSPISLCVVILEGTGQVQRLLPSPPL